eukprot:TRINITY_DN34296_c0_g1_i1.p1 TRINITY_DN34296_c0_g1~~TRINITY_DN34296_c0_g1_i1.p1  ORF type:complete len:186 (-),score=26.79 TRINITY_DN34296_c0_g1_i1:252-809(-)
MHFIVALLVGSFLLSGVEGSKCPATINVNCTTLDVKAYAGRWFEQTHSKSFVWDLDCKCISADYTIHSTSPLKIGVNNTCVNKKTGRPHSDIGRAKANSTATGECALEVAFFADFYGPYLVVDTDYKTYSIVVSCLTGAMASFSDIWILSRQQQLPKPTLNMLMTKLKTLGFDYSDVVYTQQTSC